jgi:hypothetical protein
VNRGLIVGLVFSMAVWALIMWGIWAVLTHV